MANPNIINANVIFGITTYYTPNTTANVVIVNNAASSANIYKINQVVIANTTGSAATANVFIYTNGAVGQGGAPAGGNAFPLISSVSIPGNASLVAVDKSTSFYLQEGTSLAIATGTANSLTFSTSYEAIY